MGMNSLQNYALKPSDNFKLAVHRNTDSKYVEMILQNPLDRESQEDITLLLIATDGGDPQKSGTVLIHVTVLDANDTAPIYLQGCSERELPKRHTDINSQRCGC